jgi:hypothetical protein
LDFVGVLYCQLPLMLQAIFLSLQTLLLYHQCAHIFPWWGWFSSQVSQQQFRWLSCKLHMYLQLHG